MATTMASSSPSTSTTRPSFTTLLHLSTSSSHPPPHRLPLRPHFTFFKPLTTRKPTPITSVDVSNEEDQLTPTDIQTEETDKPELLIDPRRLEEKFAVVNTGVFECRSCGYTYQQSAGDPTYPIPPGLPFDKLPEDWRCPTCGASQNFFQSKSLEVAGFAQNQQFGLGGNTLTSDQKALLIYGSLLFGFMLFLSGYFLQ